MSDPDGITGTFFWTPPSGSAPPATSSEVTTPTRKIETATTIEIPKEQTPTQVTDQPQSIEIPKGQTPTQGTNQPQSIEPDHPLITSAPRTQTQVQTQARGQDTYTQTRAQTQSTVTNLYPSPSVATSPPLITILNSARSSSWETSISGASQSSGAITSISSGVIPVGATSQPEPTPTAAPHAGLKKEVIIVISLGGFVLVAAFIGLVFCIRNRIKKARSRRNEMGIKGKISSPVQPTPAKRLSQDLLSKNVLPQSPTKRFSQDSRAALLARSASATSSFKKDTLDHSSLQRPESYTSVFSEFSTIPPLAPKPRASVMEIPPVSFSANLRVPLTTRAVSSFYGSDLYERDSVGDFVGTEKTDFGQFNPFLAVDQGRSQANFEDQYHDIKASLRSTDNYLRPPRNLTDKNRSSSLISNQRFNMENRTIAESENSNRDSEWQFDVQIGTGRRNFPAPREQSPLYSTRDARQSTYPISFLNGYRGMGGIDENAEGAMRNTRSEMANRQSQPEDEENSGGVGGTSWEEQRRRMFEQKDK